MNFCARQELASYKKPLLRAAIPLRAIAADELGRYSAIHVQANHEANALHLTIIQKQTNAIK